MHDVTALEPYSPLTCAACGQDQRVNPPFGVYQITEQIGVGGMSKVFKAKDLTLDRWVALKVLNRACTRDKQRLAQFEREAELMARMAHPNVVRVYTAGHAHGHFYIAMELVHGGSLEDLLKREGRLSEERVLQLGLQAVAGLSAASASGLIHRDIKPANLLLTKQGTVRLVDFGLAMLVTGVGAGGEIWATPQYVAPEVLEHSPEDARSDIYSLTATLYHCVTGLMPCRSESTRVAELLKAKSRPTTFDDDTRGLSPAFRQLLQRGLMFSSGERYPDYPALHEALESALRKARRGGRRPLSKWKPWLIGGAAALTGSLLGTLWDARHTRPAAQPAVAADASSPHLLPDSPSTSDRFLHARSEMIAGQFSEALSTFTTIGRASGTHQPTRHWARFNAALCAHFLGDHTRARTLFAELREPVVHIDGEEHSFFRQAADLFCTPVVLAETHADAFAPHRTRCIGLLAGGLHNWNLGETDAACDWLEKFSAATPPAAHPWIRQLQATVQPWLQTLRTLRTTIPKHISTLTPEDLARHIARTESALATIPRTGPPTSGARARLAEMYARRERLRILKLAPATP